MDPSPLGWGTPAPQNTIPLGAFGASTVAPSVLGPSRLL